MTITFFPLTLIRLIVLSSIVLFSSHAHAINFRVQYRIELESGALLGYRQVQLIGYSTQHGPVTTLQNPLILTPGTTTITPVIDTPYDIVPDGALHGLRTYLIFRLLPRYWHGYPVDVRVEIEQWARSVDENVPSFHAAIQRMDYQTEPAGRARPMIRTVFDMLTYTPYTADNIAQLDFTFTELITPIASVGTVLDFVLAGSR